MSSDTYKAIANYEAYAYCRDRGHLNFLKKDSICRKYVYGEQWNPTLQRQLEREGKPALTINKIFSTLLTICGEQINTQADIAFSPSAGGTQETADALTKLWLHVSKHCGLRWLEEMVFDSGAISSRGFFDVRMQFRNNMRGDVDIAYLKSCNVVLNPDDDDYDPDKWAQVTVTSWHTPESIALNYGREYAEELKYIPSSQFDYAYDSIDHLAYSFGGEMVRLGAMYSGQPDERVQKMIRLIDRQYRVTKRVPHFVNLRTGDIRVVPFNWDRDQIIAAKEVNQLEIIDADASIIRWTVSADKVLLHDDESPYPHFTVIPYFPFFHEGRTIGLVENLLSPQDLLNKTSSQELHIVNSTANSGWQMEEDSLVNMTPEELESKGAQSGLVLVRRKNSAPLEKIQPNQVPTGIDRISYKADQNLKEISGVSDSQRGMDRADVAAKAIRAKQVAGGVNLVKAFTNLIRTRHILARTVLALQQRYMTEERVFQITGTSLGAKQEELVINKWDDSEQRIVNDLTIGTYEVVVTDVPMRDSFQDTQFDEAVRLRTEVGIPIPDRFIIEHSHLANKNDIISELSGESSEAQQQLAQMEAQLKALESEKVKADIAKKKADTALTMARAQSELTKEDGTSESELMLKAKEMQMEAQHEQQRIAMERERTMEELKLTRERAMLEMELKRQETRQKLLLMRMEAEERARMQAENHDLQLATKAATGEQQMQQSAESHVANLQMQKESTDAKVETTKKMAAAKQKAAKKVVAKKAKAKAKSKPKRGK